jgi:hypothetical protein
MQLFIVRFENSLDAGTIPHYYLSTLDNISDFSGVLQKIGFKVKSVSIVHSHLYAVELNDTLDTLRVKKGEA